MKRLLVAVVVAWLAASGVSPALADDGDEARIVRSAALVGEQVVLQLKVVAPIGATVEVDPGLPSWNGVEVVRVASASQRNQDGRTVHTIELVVAGFIPGDTTFRPAVSVTADAVSITRELPGVALKVIPTLRANDPNELSVLPGPSAIDGAESPWLRPAIGLGVVVGVAIVLAALAFGVRAFVRVLRRPKPVFEGPGVVHGLGDAEDVIESDPVGAYRTLASAVRTVIAERYGFPAFALTTRELERRMESEGVERWQARLVGGLLEECDAVVYAGYRPANERRQADLTMAREIVEVAGT